MENILGSETLCISDEELKEMRKQALEEFIQDFEDYYNN